MIATNCFPGVPVILHALAQYPCPGHNIGAGIIQVIPGLPELIGPYRVDLHQSDIDCAIAVVVDSGRGKCAFGLGNSPKQPRRDLVPLASLLKTKGRTRAREEQKDEKKSHFQWQSPLLEYCRENGEGGKVLI